MRIDLDANASYGILLEIVPEVTNGVSLLSGNPSSIHARGQAARAQIERAREAVAALLGINSTMRLVFTSGATEANNMALRVPFHSGLHTRALNSSEGGAEVVISAIEHPSVLEVCAALGRLGVSVTQVPPDQNGEFHVEDFVRACGPATKLISVMYANNETGQVLPVLDIFNGVASVFPHILRHTDAVQALGKIPLSFPNESADLVSISGHKIGGLLGAGALAVSQRVPWSPLLFGGAQETRWRAGAENTLGIVAFGLASSVISRDLSNRIKAMERNRSTLLASLTTLLPAVEEFTSRERLPNTLNIRLPGVHAADLLVALDLEGVNISTGAACSSGKPLASHVLIARGYSEQYARESLRLSLRAEHTEAEMIEAAKRIADCVQRMSARRSKSSTNSSTSAHAPIIEEARG